MAIATFELTIQIQTSTPDVRYRKWRGGEDVEMGG